MNAKLSSRRLLVVLVLSHLVVGCASSAEVSAPDRRDVKVEPIEALHDRVVWRSAGVAVDDLAVVWGGLTGLGHDPQPVNDGWIIWPGTGEVVQTAPSGLAGRSDHVAVAHAGEVYVWGGLDEDGDVLRDGAILDPHDNTWEAMSPAPLPLASPRVVADGSDLLFGAGNGKRAKANSTIQVYHTERDSWDVVELGVPDIVDWTLIGDVVMVVSRTSDPENLLLHVFDRDGERLVAPTTLATDLNIVDYLSVVPGDDRVVVSASDRAETVLFEVDTSGDVVRDVAVDAGSFAPATRPDTLSGTMIRGGTRWVSIAEWDVTSFLLDEFAIGTGWRLDVCRNEATWIRVDSDTFLRYGGLPCGGDVPDDPGWTLTVVRFT